jgi:hypothetical protein
MIRIKALTICSCSNSRQQCRDIPLKYHIIEGGGVWLNRQRGVGYSVLFVNAASLILSSENQPNIAASTSSKAHLIFIMFRNLCPSFLPVNP